MSYQKRVFLLLITGLLVVPSCLLDKGQTEQGSTFGATELPPANERSQEVSVRDNRLVVGRTAMRGVDARPLRKRKSGGYSNGVDTFYPTRLSDGGVFVLYRYSPSTPKITTNPYPQITFPGKQIQYVTTSPERPFYEERIVEPPFYLSSPFSEMKWPALLSDAGVGLFPVAESPIFEEAIEPFVSAYPAVRLSQAGPSDIHLRFDEEQAGATSANLDWEQTKHSETATTYLSPISDSSAKAVAIQLPNARTVKGVWYRKGGAWERARVQQGGPRNPDLLIAHIDNADAIRLESRSGSPGREATLYSTIPGYVRRARWAAFTIYDWQASDEFFSRSMAPSMKAYNDRLHSLRTKAPVKSFSRSWRRSLKLVGFTEGRNLLNPKFFDRGFPVAGDPLYESDANLRNMSVSWVSDESALQAVMGARLFGFEIDDRYGIGVRTFYDPDGPFYWGALKRATDEFTAADTGSPDRVVGYNYLLSLMRLTELIDTSPGLAATEVQALVDRVLPVMQQGYAHEHREIPYLWGYPDITRPLQWEYGMGRELSEAQLSYICGLWWLRTHESKYLECQKEALELAREEALTLRGSSYLWGLDVVHGAYVNDALLLAHRTTGDSRYLDAALGGWREELLFLFSKLDYPETSFDDRAAAVTSYYSTFADLHQGNYWRNDAWNNARTLWSLSKLLKYVHDSRIVRLLGIASETHKQTMPAFDAVENPIQRSDFYDKPIDPKDYELSWEDMATRYSTQVAFSNDVWRQAFLVNSIRSSQAAVFRIPGVLLEGPGFAYVAGSPDESVKITIRARDCTFANGALTKRIRLNESGLARVRLKAAS